MTALAKLIQEIAENSDDDCRFRSSYSGRGMYGRECVGITGDRGQLQLVIAEIIKETHHSLAGLNMDFDHVVDLVMNYSEDSMGRGSIFYWPQIQMEEESN